MKVLIIATRRSGSTSFGKALSKCLNIPFICEPFNTTFDSGITKKDSYVVKTMIEQKPVEFYIDYAKKFDKVFLITRKNINRVYESLYYQLYMRDNGTKDGFWHAKYLLPEFDGENLDYKKELYTDIVNHNTLLGQFARLKKIPYIYYEDLYSDNIEVFTKTAEKLNLQLNVNQFRKLLHPSKRYRQFNRTKI